MRDDEKKPRLQDEEGVKNSENPEDKHRKDKRPRPMPGTGALDGALSDGVIAPDPDTPPTTPRE